MRDMDIERPRAEHLARQAGPLLGDYPEATVPASQEIVRSLVGSLGIIAAVPMTTAVAVAVAMSILRQRQGHRRRRRRRPPILNAQS
jgi:hypothetical protein